MKYDNPLGNLYSVESKISLIAKCFKNSYHKFSILMKFTFLWIVISKQFSDSASGFVNGFTVFDTFSLSWIFLDLSSPYPRSHFKKELFLNPIYSTVFQPYMLFDLVQRVTGRKYYRELSICFIWSKIGYWNFQIVNKCIENISKISDLQGIIQLFTEG